ncbi:immunoglobulin-like domain-containing protein, partial [Roseicyclus marinus]|uniref:immunoglobulin-like domain-containing protein n=2 Tax=Roseicyclus marinus TaxID=2161673 RepID=UPI003611279C
MSDTIDTVTVSITADGDVSEAEAASFTVSVSQALADDLVVTLSNGETVTIAAGATSASYSVAAQGDDVYVDGSEVVLSVSGASVAGETFENLVIDATQATVVVSDTIDTVTVSITADGDVSEDEAASFTVSVSQALADDLVVTLSNGETVTIAAGSTSASYSVAAQGDDVYVDGSEVVLSVSGASVAGETFENLVIDATQATVVVSDTIDTVTVSITADGDVSEAEAASFTVSVSQALADDLVVTLSNGETVTIAAGATSASYSVAAQGDDVYVDGSEVVLSVSGASVAGETFENLVIDATQATVVVSDTIDTVTVSITADGDVSEAEAASFTVSVSQALADDLVVTLSNGETVTIAAGATSASYSVAAQGDDVYVDGSEVVLSVSGASVAGETFENLVIDAAQATVVVSDTIDTVTVSITADGDVSEAEAASFTVSVSQALADDLVVTLSNGETVTIAAGAT